jgi:hypothetical protein
MKKITAVLSLFLLSQAIHAQGWFEVGAKGGYGVNFLVNKNFYSDHYFSPKLSFGYMYGGKIGINFNDSHAITIDVTSSVFEQKYNYSLLNADSTRTIYARSMGFSTLDFILLYRKASDGGYIEIGPQYSMLSKAKWSDGANKLQNTDVSGNLVKSYYAAVFGFGGYLAGTENFRVTIGFRATYALNDIISSTGKLNNFPSLTKYDTYKPSNPLTGQLILELNYDVGYFARSKCKKRKLRFLLF